MKLTAGTILTTGIIMLAAACGTSRGKSQPSQKGMPLMPKIVGATITEAIVSDDLKDTIVSMMEYEFYPAPEFPWQDSVNFKIGQFAWTTLEYGEVSYKHQPLSHQFFYDRLADFKRTYKLYEKEAAYSAVWEYEGHYKIIDNLKNYAQLSQQAYMFTGGAHPNSFYLTSVISKEDGTTLKLKDMVNDPVKFNKITEKYFLAERGIKAEELASEDFWFENKQFECNDNFSISPEGITFFFNPYEIAPYAFGTTEFTVPMNEIKGLLKVDLQFEK